MLMCLSVARVSFLAGSLQPLNPTQPGNPGVQTQSTAPDPRLLIQMFGGLGLYLPDVRGQPWVPCQRSELEAGNVPESENFLPFSCTNWDPHHLCFEESSDSCPARHSIFDLLPRVAPGLHGVGSVECIGREGGLRAALGGARPPPPLLVPRACLSGPRSSQPLSSQGKHSWGCEGFFPQMEKSIW